MIERTDKIAKWIKILDDDSKEAILKTLIVLQNIGPDLGRPYVDTIKGSKPGCRGLRPLHPLLQTIYMINTLKKEKGEN